MINHVLVGKGGKVESKKFDDSITITFSEGAFKKINKTDELSFVADNTHQKLPINHHFFEESIKKETLRAKRFPDNPKVFLRIGDIYFSNNKFHKARNYYSKAFSLDRENPVIAKKLVSALLAENKLENADHVLTLVEDLNDVRLMNIHGVLKIALGQTEAAESLFNKIDNDSTNYYEAVNSLGLIYLIRNEFNKAKRYFQQSIDSYDNYPQAQNNLAVAMAALGETESAIEQYKKVITKYPNYLEAFNNLFQLYITQEKVAEGLELMRSAKHLVVRDVDIQFKIGWCLMVMGKYDEAIAAYEKVFEYLPNNPNTLNNIGFCWYKLNSLKEAENYFLLSARQKKSPIHPFRNLLKVYEQTGNVEGVREFAEKVLQRDPTDIYGRVYYGGYLVEQEHWEEAHELLLAAYKEKPPLITLYLSLTFIYADIFPDFEKGMEIISYVLKTKFDQYELIYNNYLHLLLMNNRIKEARKIVKLVSNDTQPISVSTLGLYYLMTGNTDEANKKYELAITTAAEKFKLKIKQQKAYDFARSALLRNEYKAAEKYLHDAIKFEDKGFKYITAACKDLLEEIEQK